MKKIILSALFMSSFCPACILPITSCGQNNKTDFCTDTWSNVITQAEKGLESLKSYYNCDTFVGMERVIDFYGLPHKVVVVGENEDVVTTSNGNEAKTATLTFQFKTLLTYVDDDGDHKPILLNVCSEEEKTAPSPRRWQDSVVREYLNSDFIKGQIELALGKRGAIKKVRKNCLKYEFESQTPTRGQLTDEYVFLPSLGDIYSQEFNQLPLLNLTSTKLKYADEANVIDGQTHSYSYYQKLIGENGRYNKRNTDLILKDADGYTWAYWLKTPVIDKNQTEQAGYLTYNQWYMSYYGEADDIFGLEPTNNYLGLAPMFCI